MDRDGRATRDGACATRLRIRSHRERLGTPTRGYRRARIQQGGYSLRYYGAAAQDRRKYRVTNPAHGKGKLNGVRVLVVEDEAMVAMLIEAMLDDLGCGI